MAAIVLFSARDGKRESHFTSSPGGKFGQDIDYRQRKKEDEAEMDRQPVDAGTSQMMITKDETVIGIKSVLANGEITMEIFRKQPKAAKPAEPEYITREEFEQRIAAMIRAAEPVREICSEPETGTEDEPAPIRRTATKTGGAKRS